jgi:MtN3 and saliva related transmembrane protein
LKLHIPPITDQLVVFACASMETPVRNSNESSGLELTRVEREWSAIMAAWFESVGDVAAACTTLCWLPQALKIIREKRTEGVSLITQSVFTFGIALWATYGLLLNNRPILYANVVTLVFSLTILILKLRYPSVSEK